MIQQQMRQEIIANLKCFENMQINSDESIIDVFLENRKGTVRFYDFYINDISEMQIEDCITKEVIFYLHFEMLELENALSFLRCFLNVMIQGLSVCTQYEPKEEQAFKNILLVCTGGLSTYLFAKLMEEHFQKMGLYIHVDAARLASMDEKAKEADLILLAPQVSYCYKKISKKYPNKVQLINTEDFATLNVDGVIGSQIFH